MDIEELTRKGEGYIMNKIPINLFGMAKIISKEKGDRIIAGYANLAVVDSQNQLIPTETLKAGIETLMTDLSYANLMLFHKNIQVGKILPEWGELKTHVDNKGLFIVAEIRDDTEIATDIWNQIVDGEINGFSIGCEVIDSHDKCDLEGKNCIEILDKINIFEVSLTNFPANEMSGFVVVSKSNYDKGNLDFNSYENVCDECAIDKGNMTKKKKVESEVKDTKDETKLEEETKDEQEKTEEVELSDAERIEKLERDISNILAVISKLTGEEEKSDEKEEEPKEPVEEKTVEPEPEPEPEQKSDDYEGLKKAIDGIGQDLAGVVEKLSSLFSEKKEESDIEELKLALKARDDQIEALNKKIEVLDKDDEEQKESKTLQKGEEEDTVELEPDEQFIVRNGEVYRV